MKYRLPLVLEQAVRGAASTRQLVAADFESKLRRELVDHKGTVTCQKGCHDCCYYPMMLSVLEGVTLFRWLVDHDLWKKPLTDKVKEVHKRVWGLSPSVWLLSMTPCPLLTDEGLCGAYEGRPFVCRTTISTGDPYYCHPHRFSSGQAGIAPRREAEIPVHEAENRLLKAARLPLLRMPLATAVLMGEKLCKEGLEPEEVTEQLFFEWATEC